MARLLTPKVHGFIRDARSAGAEDAHIKVQLLQSGWKTHQINQLFHEMGPAPAVPEVVNNPAWAWPVSIMIGSVVVLSLMLFSFITPGGITGFAVGEGIDVTQSPYFPSFAVLVMANAIFMIVAITFVVLTLRWERNQ